jgi:hypothetical protein
MDGDEPKAMDGDVTQDSWFARRGPTLAVAVGVLLVAALGWAALQPAAPRTATTDPTIVQSRPGDDGLIGARTTLSKATDVESCWAALQQINAYISEHGDARPAGVSAADAARLKKDLELTDAAYTELEGTNYSRLDANHIAACCLLSDAARGLAAEEVGPDGKRVVQTPLERAAAAFAWVMREVRLGDAAQTISPEAVARSPQGTPVDVLPPEYILRRGVGSPRDRALVFLALLEQVESKERLRGCLVIVPDKDKGNKSLWACGVVIGESPDLFLFDPRLGLPLPGPGGQGVATLKGVVADPAVLAQLNDKNAPPYDITPERAAKAELYSAPSLSAVAPRMRHLQETLLSGAVAARLWDDYLGDLDRLTKAAQVVDPKAKAHPSPEAVDILRNFLQREDGGADVGAPFPLRRLTGFTSNNDPAVPNLPRRVVYNLQLTPWEYFPTDFRNPKYFSYGAGLGQRVRDIFGAPFMSAAMKSDGPRELLLRAHYHQAVEKLIDEDRVFGLAKQRLEQAEGLMNRVNEWLTREAIVAYADEQRAKSGAADARAEASRKVAEAWQHGEAVFVLLQGATAMARRGQVIYQLGLCRQEEAEQRQARLDLLVHAGLKPTEADSTAARDLWVDARGYWERYLADYGAEPAGAAARENLARAQVYLGENNDALKTLDELAATRSGLDKLAARYKARLLQKSTENK